MLYRYTYTYGYWDKRTVTSVYSTERFPGLRKDADENEVHRFSRLETRMRAPLLALMIDQGRELFPSVNSKVKRKKLIKTLTNDYKIPYTYARQIYDALYVTEFLDIDNKDRAKMTDKWLMHLLGVEDNSLVVINSFKMQDGDEAVFLARSEKEYMREYGELPVIESLEEHSSVV